MQQIISRYERPIEDWLTAKLKREHGIWMQYKCVSRPVESQVMAMPYFKSVQIAWVDERIFLDRYSEDSIETESETETESHPISSTLIIVRAENACMMLAYAEQPVRDAEQPVRDAQTTATRLNAHREVLGYVMNAIQRDYSSIVEYYNK